MTLPERGDLDWDTPLNTEVSAARSDAADALANSNNAVSTANYARQLAETVQEFTVTATDDQIADRVADDDSASAGAVDTRIAEVGSVRFATKTKVTVGKTDAYDFNTNDYASDDLAFQAAVDSLPTGFTAGGGTVECGPYAFDFVGPVDASAVPNVRLVGCGFRTKIRWASGNTFADTTPGANYLFKGGYGFITHDIWWDGQSSYTCPINGVGTQAASGGTNTLGGGILLTNGRNFVDRTYITGMAEDGITAKGAIGAKYGLVEIIRCGGTGLNITATVHATIPGVYSTDQDLSSVWIGSCYRGIYVGVGGQGIIAPHVWGCETDAIDVDASYVRILGAYPESNAGWGIVVRKPNVTVTGCDLWGNGRGATPAGGIHLASTSVNGVIISDNQLRDNRSDSVLINGARYCQVRGNVISDSYARSVTNPDSATSYTASGTQTLTTTFTDANAPSWMAAAQAAMNCTVVITGAGAAGAVHTAQVVGWNSTTSVTLSLAQVTATVDPVYSVYAVSYGIREAGSAFGNDIQNNTVHKNDSVRGGIVPIQGNGVVGTRAGNNIGADAQAWYELGNVSGGSLLLDARNGGVIHGTLTANVTAVSILATGPRRNQQLTVLLTQDGTGGRTVAGWPSTVKFAGGITPVVTATAGATWVLQLKYDGTNWIEQGRAPANVQERWLASNVTYTSATGLATVGTLSVPLAASEKVFVRGMLVFDGGQTGDAKFRLQATNATGATGWFGLTYGPNASATSTTAVSANPGNAIAVAASGGGAPIVGTVGVGTYQFVHFAGYVAADTTAGTLELQAAQQTSDATALTIYAGSWMEVKKVA